jgi:hypothetical protein
MCALAIQGAAVADATANTSLRLSAFRLRYYLLFLPVRHPCQSDALRRRFANASTGICLLQLCMEHRMKSVATI